MRIALDIRKSVDENAARYFELAKKERKKIDGTRKAIEDHKEKLLLEAKKDEARELSRQIAKKKRKQEWYEKFRWFISSDNLLVIGGRDATTNEIIIKKYTEKDDLVFHTDMSGSPFVVVKRQGFLGDVPKTTLDEAASFTAIFSRAWRQGLGSFSVFSVNPDQVSKNPNTGEYLEKGSFVIRGETTRYTPSLIFGIGLYEDKVMGGPLSAIRKHCNKHIELTQGDEKNSDLAKSIQRLIGGELDDILRATPQNSRIRKAK